MRKIVKIFNTGDLTEVDSLFSSNYLDHQRPSAMKKKGREEFKAIVLLARKDIPSLKASIIDMISEKDKVVARLKWHGKKINRETIDILRIGQGRVTEHWGAEI